jgi:hypothetical protein
VSGGRARVGDRPVVESRQRGGPRRRGQIVRPRHPDGSPPYAVHRAEDDRETLFLPGPERHLAGSPEQAAGAAAAP